MIDIASRLKAKWLKWHREHSQLRIAVHEYANPVDDPKNAQFMNDACDAWGNNGEPIRPEDCDVDESPFEDRR